MYPSQVKWLNALSLRSQPRQSNSWAQSDTRRRNQSNSVPCSQPIPGISSGHLVRCNRARKSLNTSSAMNPKSFDYNNPLLALPVASERQAMSNGVPSITWTESMRRCSPEQSCYDVD